MPRTRITDSADIPNRLPLNASSVEYDTGVNRSVGQSISYRLLAAITAIVLSVILLLCFWIKQFLSDKYRYDPEFSWIVDKGLMLIFTAFFVGLAIVVLVALIAGFNWAWKMGLVDLPGGLKVYITDIKSGWQRPRPYFWMNRWLTAHFSVQEWIAKRQYPNVTTWAPELRIIKNNAELTGVDDLGQLRAGAEENFDQIIDQMAGDTSSALMLGRVAEDEPSGR